MRRRFRCYAEADGGQWVGVCLDLDIAIQAPSLEAVVRDLTSAISFHLETIAALPEAEQERFLHRRAPLALRFRFLWYALRDIFRGDGPERAGFIADCPA